MRIVEKVLRTEEGNIHYWSCFVENSRPWLVFLPGLTADHHLFDLQMVELGQRYNCLVWDAPGHGKSRPFPLTFSMDSLAEYLFRILQMEGIHRPILVGQSLGGYISQVFMDRYPHSLRGFVSIDSAPMSRSYYVKARLLQMKHLEGIYLSIPWNLLVEWISAGTAATQYGRRVMRWTMRQYERRELCTLAAYGMRMIAEAIETERPFDITCPALLLCGEKEFREMRFYNRRWAWRTGHNLVWVPGAGHNSNTDSPEFVNGKIEQFIRFLPLL